MMNQKYIIWKKVVTLFNVIFWHLSGGTEENHENTKARAGSRYVTCTPFMK
jgi:hypothetical protein